MKYNPLYLGTKYFCIDALVIRTNPHDEAVPRRRFTLYTRKKTDHTVWANPNRERAMLDTKWYSYYDVNEFFNVIAEYDLGETAQTPGYAHAPRYNIKLKDNVRILAKCKISKNLVLKSVRIFSGVPVAIDVEINGKIDPMVSAIVARYFVFSSTKW